MMRIVFCGTPEFAVPSFRRLLASPDFTIAAVVTQPARPRGRGRAIAAPPVKQAAVEAGLPVHQPESIKSEAAYDLLSGIHPDAVVIIAYGQIVPRRLLGIARLGWINLHASLLPKYRGAAPIAWAVVNGETRTGLTTMQIDAGMDTGPILLQRDMTIGADETAPELGRRMAEAGALLLIETLQKLDRGEIRPAAQEHSQASYAPRLKKEDGRIDWSGPARRIYDRIRGLAPWPGAFTAFRGQTCHVWGHAADEGGSSLEPPGTLLISGGAVEVICGENSRLALDEIQLEGRRRITAQEFANGFHLRSGERLG
jgi:methionyl-tRNA formyltransferase